MGINNPSGEARIANGNYTGDGTAARAISHSLGRVPRVIIINDAAGFWHIQPGITAAANTWNYCQKTTPAIVLEECSDATSLVFYVGSGIGDGTNSANKNGNTYNWIAIG